MHASHARQLGYSRRGKTAVADIPLTPMIDVVFQLLIYFVLTFELPDRISQMQVWRPSGPGTPTGLVVDRITIFPQGRFTFNDTRVSLDTLKSTFQRFADLDPNRQMIVVASGESAHNSLVQVLDAANQAGLNNISLLSTP